MVSVTGRVVFIRNTGKLCFATLQEGLSLADSGVRLQVMLSLAEVGEEPLADWKADVDLGDFVSVTGRVISSQRGELSVLALGVAAGVQGAAADARTCTTSCPTRPGSGSATPT